MLAVKPYWMVWFRQQSFYILSFKYHVELTPILHSLHPVQNGLKQQEENPEVYLPRPHSSGLPNCNEPERKITSAFFPPAQKLHFLALAHLNPIPEIWISTRQKMDICNTHDKTIKTRNIGFTSRSLQWFEWSHKTWCIEGHEEMLCRDNDNSCKGLV